METELGYTKTKIVTWNGDWNNYKRLFKAASRLNGTADAIQAGEQVAEGLPWPPKETETETSKDFMKRVSESWLVSKSWLGVSESLNCFL